MGAVLLAGGGCVPHDAATGVAASWVPLDPRDPARDRVGRLVYRGGLIVQGGVNGLSALDVSPDARQLLAISDLGWWVRATLDYDREGRLARFAEIARGRLTDADGQPVRRPRDDAESLARLRDGRWVIGFERHHRLLLYPGDEGRQGPVGWPRPLPRPPGLVQAPSNGGIEALTLLPDGRLLALEEGRDEAGGLHRAWLGTAQDWESRVYRSEPGFRPTGAATLPSGDVLVLERRFSVLGGFAARVVRLSAGGLDRGREIAGVELARLEPPLTVDNLEGIAVVPDPFGAGVLVFLVSDNNGFPLQRTLVLAFGLGS